MLNDNYIYTIDNKILNILKRKIEYFTKETRFILVKEKEDIYAIPISSNVSKYKRLISAKLKEFGVCQTILIKDIDGKKFAILFQESFPILERYLKKGQGIITNQNVKRQVLVAFHFLMYLKKRGKDLFYVNMDFVKNIMLSLK